MRDSYIRKIYVEKIRNLSKLDILLSEHEKKHLILTGKNGSGKTTLINAMVDYLRFIERNEGDFPNRINNDIRIFKEAQERLKDKTDEKSINESKNLKVIMENRKKELPLQKYGLNIDIANQFDCVTNYQAGKFVICNFAARRISNYEVPSGVDKINFQEQYNFDLKANAKFVKYMVDLKTQQAYANQENDVVGVEYYTEWFENLSNLLCKLFNDSDLKLVYKYRDYRFEIHTSDGKCFGFNEMSDGYSAIFDIVTELMSRMEKYSEHRYDFQGIVFIDEIETHLHVELQKNILPILTSIFPEIQFIITTHSPFVLASIKNSVIYDLEKKGRIEDLTKYSYENILQNYFEVNSFSNVIVDFITEYRNKLDEYYEDRDINVFKELEKMEDYLNNTEIALDKSLLYEFNKLKLRKRSILNG